MLHSKAAGSAPGQTSRSAIRLAEKWKIVGICRGFLRIPGRFTSHPESHPKPSKAFRQ
ncbi:hypothetical protein D3C81_817210 [compost metagenome]